MLNMRMARTFVRVLFGTNKSSYYLCVVVQRMVLNNGKEKAGRSSEQLIHIHIAKIAIRFHFSK